MFERRVWRGGAETAGEALPTIEPWFVKDSARTHEMGGSLMDRGFWETQRCGWGKESTNYHTISLSTYLETFWQLHSCSTYLWVLTSERWFSDAWLPKSGQENGGLSASHECFAHPFGSETTMRSLRILKPQ